VKVWYKKWDALEYEDEKDVSEYTTCFKKIYKRVNPLKRIPSKTIVRKFINSLPFKYVKLLTIIGLSNLNEAINAALDIEASQKVKTKKWDQTYMVDTIKELRQEVHSLQVG